MNITQAKQYVLDTVRAYMQLDEDGMPVIDPHMQRPLFLVGPPGIGKTAIMSQVAEELGVGLIAYSMTHHTRQSALGLPVIEHQSYKGFEYDASEYTMSEIIASIYSYMRKTGIEQGILFLDEVNCVSETLYPSMLQFLQFKTFGAHEVPNGWVIACAGNPAVYNRSVHEFDVATMDRVRKIEIEPDFEAWKHYAAEAGVHPAITAFLETQPDYFYRIESSPGSTSFATARGWEDLSRMIALNEMLDIPVKQELIEQFIQDTEIAEKFSLYYDLFRKYRSDYQIPSIVNGTYPAEIAERARNARLDERMALLGLLLDALSPQAGDVMMQEQVLTETRDALRAVKPEIMAGADLAQSLEKTIEEHAETERRIEEKGLRELGELRAAKRVTNMLKSCRNACTVAGTEAGAAAFEIMHQEFRGYVGSFEAEVGSLRDKLENAFLFLEDAFGDGRETLLFTTELAARKPCALFIARYGCDGFVRHNQELQVAERRTNLLDRIEAVERDVTSQRASLDEKPAGETHHKTKQADSELAAYYENACWEFGYASLCHMALPANLSGKTVLDVGCRRGKGVFKLSERVGASGHAIGIDWVPDHIGQAVERADKAARETGLPANNMEFHLAYPEDLMAAGVGNGTVDLAFINSILHLTYKPAETLAEIHRVLKPGGLLVLEVALANGPRDESVVEAARELGNSIQAAPCRADFEAWLDELGYDVEVAEEPHSVEANMGFKRDHAFPTAPSTEDVGFEALVLHAYKR